MSGGWLKNNESESQIILDIDNIMFRCECNSHAARCHFDRAVFEASGLLNFLAYFYKSAL